eukprot:TRINITY_DN26086_c0_g1_i7.p1 TRINITY_DN26086_c0_g1~~TRINITY_DN26086_c0_g1_i7.p1  ORF type:complete len:252 (-),score=47.62 TRINITY_DN26086_c0_g1_i7:192-947(-)
MGNRCMTICCPPDTEGADAVEEALQSHSEALRSGLSTASTLHGEILRDPLASHKTMATILPGDEKQPGPPPVRTPSKEVEARLAAMERATRPPGALDSQQTILDGYDAAGIAMPLRGNRLGSFASTLPAGPSRLASFRTEEARISAGPTRLASFQTDVGAHAASMLAEEWPPGPGEPSRLSFQTLPGRDSFAEERDPGRDPALLAHNVAPVAAGQGFVAPTQELLKAHEATSKPVTGKKTFSNLPWWAARA